MAPLVLFGQSKGKSNASYLSETLTVLNAQFAGKLWFEDLASQQHIDSYACYSIVYSLASRGIVRNLMLKVEYVDSACLLARIRPIPMKSKDGSRLNHIATKRWLIPTAALLLLLYCRGTIG